MATISSAGLGSGLDVNSIIAQLMTIERQPLAKLETDEKTLTTRLSDIGKLQGMVSAMRDKAGSLSSATLWSRTSGTSSDPAVAVTTATGATAGSYAVQVQQLAAAQTVSSRRFTDAAPGTFGEGTLTIELGEWTGTPPAITGFAPQAGASAVTVTLGPDDDTLAEVRDKINAADAGVTATIINDAGGARLAIRSTASGAENGFRISAAETVDDGDAANGLSALAFDALAASPTTLNQRAANAKATINGIEVESATNTLADVSDGVTLKLTRTTSAPVEVNVASDTAAVKTAVEEFVAAFNTLATHIRTQTQYDDVAKKGGALQGDSLVLGVQRQMRSMLAVASSASSEFGRLSDIGISLQRDGTLSIDSGALDKALTDPAELRKLLATDGTGVADSGIMRRFKDLGDALLGEEGAFDTRNDSLRARIERNEERQEQMQARLDSTEKRLRAQYTALDRSMGQLNGLSDYVSQQMQALSNFYDARNNG
jgi:flagellar hook-associated protein 2